MKASEHLTAARLALEAEYTGDPNRDFFVRAVLRTIEIALDQVSCITEHDKATEQPIPY